jgi:hypothetical protein
VLARDTRKSSHNWENCGIHTAFRSYTTSQNFLRRTKPENGTQESKFYKNPRIVCMAFYVNAEKDAEDRQVDQLTPGSPNTNGI